MGGEIPAVKLDRERGARVATVAPSCHAAAVVVGLLLAAVPLCATAGDTAAPAPTAASPLVVSDAAPQGCCCIKDSASAKPAGCGYGLSRDKCETAGKTLPTWSATWTAGKCPEEP